MPYTAISTGMLPHQCSAFFEGWFGPMHSEFERTPKAATVTTPGAPAAIRTRQHVKVHWPYVLAEAAFASYQVGWGVAFAVSGIWWASLVAFAQATCVLGLMYRYGDHLDRVCFVIPRAARGRRGLRRARRRT